MELRYRPDVKDVVDGMVLGMPGVKASKAFGHPAYKVNGKIFAFVGINGIALKLPAQRVQELIAAQPTTMRVFAECMKIEAFERAQPAKQPDAE